jgi:tetratricopeptide (TPR) repeat protein
VVSGAVATPEPRQPQVPPAHSAAPGSRTNKATDGQSDYQRDLDRIKAAIAETGPEALATPVDTPRAIRYAYSLYQRAVLTGDLTQLPAAEQAIDITINHLPNPGDLYLLKAKLAFKLHRLADVKRSLAAIPSLAEAAEAKGLEADQYFQEGQYEKAKAAYVRIIDEEPTWDNLARLSYFVASMGEIADADDLFARAEDQLTAKEMRSYAWLELQRGSLDIAQGRHDEALGHYHRADRAYSGDWLVAEHIAEAMAARGNYQDAAKLYETLIARVPKPELRQALGELYSVMGNEDRAKPLFDAAEASYLESARRGEVHYYHHLADLYADSIRSSSDAVKWARQDIMLRENFGTQSALAWALCRNSEVDEAARWMAKALTSGAKSAHLFHRASRIFAAAGRSAESADYSLLAWEMNPRLLSFHVHR